MRIPTHYVYVDVLLEVARMHPTMPHRDLVDFVDQIIIPRAKRQDLEDQMVSMHYVMGNWHKHKTHT